jgi:hypothetical protein
VVLYDLMVNLERGEVRNDMGFNRCFVSLLLCCGCVGCWIPLRWCCMT